MSQSCGAAKVVKADSRLLLDPRFVDRPSPQMISCIYGAGNQADKLRPPLNREVSCRQIRQFRHGGFGDWREYLFRRTAAPRLRAPNTSVRLRRRTWPAPRSPAAPRPGSLPLGSEMPRNRGPPSLAFTIQEFCDAHRISRAHYYNLKRRRPRSRRDRRWRRHHHHRGIRSALARGAARRLRVGNPMTPTKMLPQPWSRPTQRADPA